MEKIVCRICNKEIKTKNNSVLALLFFAPSFFHKDCYVKHINSKESKGLGEPLNSMFHYMKCLFLILVSLLLIIYYLHKGNIDNCYALIFFICLICIFRLFIYFFYIRKIDKLDDIHKDKKYF